jgi:tetratricopeptide (TPR) repeat protein
MDRARLRSSRIEMLNAISEQAATVRLAVAIAFCMLALGGCTWRLPHGVAEQYIADLQAFNYAACYKALAEQDRKDRALKDFLAEIPLAPDVSPLWFKPILHNTHYELGEVHRNADGTTAYVPVKVTAPDLPLWERTLDAAAGFDGSGADTALRSLDTGDYPKWTYDDRIVLAKEHHRWRVVAGFAMKDRVADTRREAMVDFQEHKYDKAIAAYGQMMATLDKLDATGAMGLAARYRRELADIENAKAQLAETDAYVPKLKLTDVAMKMSDERVPAIFGKVINAGDKPIDDIELAVTWYEGRGKDLRAAYTEKHPVFLTPIEFTDFTRSVLPLVPGQEQTFGFILIAPVEVQQDGSPYVTVSSITFAQSKAPLPKIIGASADVTKKSLPAPPAPAQAPTGPQGVAVAKPQPAAKP